MVPTLLDYIAATSLSDYVVPNQGFSPHADNVNDSANSLPLENPARPSVTHHQDSHAVWNPGLGPCVRPFYGSDISASSRACTIQRYHHASLAVWRKNSVTKPMQDYKSKFLKTPFIVLDNAKLHEKNTC